MGELQKLKNKFKTSLLLQNKQKDELIYILNCIHRLYNAANLRSTDYAENISILPQMHNLYVNIRRYMSAVYIMEGRFPQYVLFSIYGNCLHYKTSLENQKY